MVHKLAPPPPPNSIRDLDELECKFHEQFYRAATELLIADLAMYRQNAEEMLEEYFNRFKMARNRYFVRMLQSEFANMAFNDLHFKTRDHFEDQHPNLFDLGVQVAQYKQF